MSKIKQFLPFILVTSTTATLTALGNEMVRWGVDGLRAKFGPKPKQKEEDKHNGNQEGN